MLPLEILSHLTADDLSNLAEHHRQQAQLYECQANRLIRLRNRAADAAERKRCLDTAARRVIELTAQGGTLPSAIEQIATETGQSPTALRA